MILAALLLTVIPSAFADRYVFKWIDANGATHFGDRPPESAARSVTTVQIKLPTAPPAEANDDQVLPDSETAAADNVDAFDYEKLEIISPTNGEAVTGNDDTVRVSLSLEPVLRDGDDLRIYLDGSRQSLESLDVELDNVLPGEHRIQAEVVSASGTLMLRSEPIRFFVRQSNAAR